MFAARNSLQNSIDLIGCGRGNSDLQAPGSHGLYDLGEGLTVCYDSAVRHVRLHGSPQGSLSLLAEVINFVDDNDFERLLGFSIELLAPCDFFN